MATELGPTPVKEPASGGTPIHHGPKGVGEDNAIASQGKWAAWLLAPTIIALAIGAPVLPASPWRLPDGSHVLGFEAPLPVIADADPDREIRLNTRGYNQALERLGHGVSHGNGNGVSAFGARPASKADSAWAS